MKEIKFRGYSITDKKWVYGNLIEKDKEYWILEKAIGCYSKNRKNNVYDCLGGRFRFELHCVSKESLGQFIGLKDKNGKEIYVGDIAALIDIETYVKSIGVIIFNKKYASFDVKEINKNKVEYYNFFDLSICKIKTKVIGNIFENPELLEQK